MYVLITYYTYFWLKVDKKYLNCLTSVHDLLIQTDMSRSVQIMQQYLHVYIAYLYYDVMLFLMLQVISFKCSKHASAYSFCFLGDIFEVLLCSNL